jgi:hypothetical protein
VDAEPKTDAVVGHVGQNPGVLIAIQQCEPNRTREIFLICKKLHR